MLALTKATHVRTIHLDFDAMALASEASFNHFGADVEPNVTAEPRENSSKLPAKPIQGILARPRDANEGAGTSLAKS